MKFLLKITLKLLIIIALLAVAAYIAAPYIVENVLLRQLERQGLENISIRAERPKWNAIKLNWLSVESRQGAVKWLLEAKDTNAQINPLELLRGNLPQLTVAQAYLKIDSRSRSEVNVQSDFELGLPAQWLRLVPLRSFDINQLAINWVGKQNKFNYDGVASGSRIADRMQLALSITRRDSPQRTRYTSTLLMTTSGQVSLTITDDTENSSESLLSFKARLTDRNNAIELGKAELAFDTLALNQLATELRLFEPIDAKISGQFICLPRGHINKKIVAGSPIKYRLFGDVYAKLDSVAAPFYAYDAAAEIYASFAVDHVSTDITIESKSIIETAPPDELLAFAKSSPQLLPLATTKPLRIDVVEPVRFQSDMALGELVDLQKWQMKGLITASLPLNNGQQWLLSLDSPSVSISDLVTLNARYTLRLPLGQLDFDEGYVKPSSLNLSGLISARSDQVSVSLDHQSSWSTAKAKFGETVLNKPQIVLSKGVAVYYDVSTQRWQSNNAQFVLQAEPLTIGEVTITPQAMNIDVEQALGVGDKWSISGLLDIELSLKSAQVDKALALTINAPFKADQNVLTGTNTLSFKNSSAVMSGEFAYEWREATGGVHLQATASPLKDWIEAAAVFMPNKLADLQLEEGALDADVSLLLLENDTKAKADVRLTGIVASHGDVVINGGSSRIIVDDLFEFSSKKKSTVALALFDVGLPIKNIRFTIRPRLTKEGSTEFLVSDFSAQLLGGRIVAKNLIWDPNKLSQFNLLVQGLELEEVLALEQQEGLKGSGLIDGVIPISVSANGEISIDSGRLQARSPGGVLAYRGEDINALVKDNQGLEIVAKALEDFRYQNLNAKVQYQPSGDMVLALSIVGHNPNFENGRQINLNVNVEENVKSLLQSLQLADDLAGRIDRRVQQGLKQNADNE
ncbi:MAG: hypothetical protein GXP21_08080 [Gammaproteobacteria bacterium]|nr:hypothetical protein [Gammaproteobacteria bacterium]